MEKVKSLYIDRPSWANPICVDDFLVTIGIKKSNSVYHIIDVKAKPQSNKKVIRYYVKVFDSDLLTALKRTNEQNLIPLTWYRR